MVKAETSAESEGGASFVGYASVFDNVDSYGDVVRKGAFAKSIAALESEGATPLGVYYAHNMNSSPYGLVGVVTSIAEDDIGLRVEADLFVDTNPEAAFLHEAMKAGVINEMSFAYYVNEGAFAMHDGTEVYEIKDVDLLEVSVCPVGVNRQALVQEVKARVGQRRKSDAPLVLEDDETTDLAALAETVAELGKAVEALREDVDALKPDDEPDDERSTDDAGDAGKANSDTDSEAAATETEKALAHRARVAKALAGAGKDQ